MTPFSTRDPRLNQLWHHPKTELQDTEWHGPFENLPDGGLLTMVNVEGDIQAFASADEGKTWQPRARIAKEGMPFRIRDGNGDTLLLRTEAGVMLCAFLDTADEKISWDQKRREPLPDNKRWAWLARSFDDGKTWLEASLVQKGYCGALRDILQLPTGELVLVGQDVANKPGQDFTTSHVRNGNRDRRLAIYVLEPLLTHLSKRTNRNGKRHHPIGYAT